MSLKFALIASAGCCWLAVSAPATAQSMPGGQVAPGIITGAATKGPAGSDELHCIFDRGWKVWLRLTFRQ